MASYDYDLIVIGSGAGGSIAAQQVAKAGKKVALVESGTFGGSEVTAGSVPINALLQSARVYESAKHGGRFGVRSSTTGYNYPTVKAWKDLVVKRTGIHTGEDSFIKMGINVIRGRAYFIDAHTITIGAARFTAAEFLVASGSEASLPEITGLTKNGFITAREAVNVTRPPKKLAIIGGGKYSYELAQLFAIFGTKIYFIESAPRLLAHGEPEVSKHLEASFKEQYSMSVLLEATVEKVEATAIGKKVTILQAGKRMAVSVDEILVATEKKALTDIGLENAGIQYQDGAISTDSAMRTTASHIYATGSCTGAKGSGHVAAYQSQVVAHNVLHSRSPVHMDYRATPQVIYTNPEIASVGLSESDCKSQRLDIKTVAVPISIITRANIADFSDGFIKIIASKKTNVLLGATIVSPNASEMIHELTLAVQNYLTAEQVARTVHVFPSWSEVIRVACAKLSKL